MDKSSAVERFFEGRLIELAELVDDGLLSAELASLRSGLSVDDFLRKKGELQNNLR